MLARLYDLGLQGGPPMGLLALLAAAALAIIVDRVLVFRHEPAVDGGLWERLEAAWRDGGPGALRDDARAAGGAVAALAEAAGQTSSATSREAALELAAREQERRLGGPVAALGVTAELALLVGLLGAAWHMLTAFGLLRSHGLDDAAQVGDHAVSALIVCAAGAVVALVAYLGYVAHGVWLRRLTGGIAAAQRGLLRLADETEAEP